MNIIRYLAKCQYTDLGLSALELARMYGHVDIVQYFMEKQHCNPKWIEDNGLTPLHLACGRGHADIVRYLVEHQHYDPKCVSHNGKTLLHLACECGHISIVQYLVDDQHCDSKWISNDGLTPLHLACKCGHMDIIRYLVEDQHCDPHCVDNRKQIPLHLACEYGHINTVQYLIENWHCDPKCTDMWNQTPLHLACLRGHLNIVQYLVEDQHCDPCINTNLDQIPYYADGEQPREEMKLMDSALGMTFKIGPAHVAQYLVFVIARRRYWPFLMHFVAEGFSNPELSEPSTGKTLLHIACEQGQLDVIQYLTAELNCNTAVKDAHGITPLHTAIIHGQWETVRYLMNNWDENNYSNLLTAMSEAVHLSGERETLLHMACRLGHLELVEHVLSIPEMDIDATNARGETAIFVAKNFSTMKCLVQNGASFSHTIAHKYIEAAATPGNVHSSLPSFVKLYIIGNPFSGKTTLAKAIQDEHTKDASGKIEEIQSRTAGIILSEFESKELGPIAIYDFAGHPEYYVSHSAILQNSLSTTAAIFLALTDLRESDQDIIHHLQYWLSYIENHCISVVSRPHLVVIGSHLDECLNAEMKLATLENTLKSSPVIFSSVYYAGLVALDCRKPASDRMAKLRQILRSSCCVLRVASIESLFYKLVSVSLLDLFKGKLSLQLTTLVAIAQKTKFTSLHSPLKVFQICEQLNDRGHVLFLPNANRIEDSWIVIDKEVLLSIINGTLFAPPHFKEHQGISSDTGVVPVSRLTSLFSQFDPDLIIQCLVHLEFCQLIEDRDILKNLMSEIDTIIPPTTHENYLFFPSLVSIQKPPFAWADEEQFEYHCGWYLHCVSPHQFLTSRFLQILLLRLIFSFAAASPPKLNEKTSRVTHRECSVWKNGIRWQDLNGIEVIVEAVGQQKGILVMMRCLVGAELDCVKLRSAIICKVLATKKEICEKVITTESLIYPSELKQYPTKDIRMIKQCDFSVVTRAISEGKPCVYDQSKTSFIRLDDLLYFEPFAHLGRVLLREMFQTSLKNRDIPEQTLFNIAKKACNKVSKLDAFSTVFDVPPDSNYGQCSPPVQVCLQIFKEGLQLCKCQSYEDFRNKLDEYSIFCGRNPLEVEGSPLQSHSGSHLSAPPTALPPPPATYKYDRMLQKSHMIISNLAAAKCSGVLADKLHSTKLITDSIYEQGTNFGPGVVESTRVRSIINAVLAKVKINQENYDRFVEILREINGMEDLVELMTGSKT